ncbi:MAG: GFA family protein [Burkholderiaceae bacterium]
MSVTIPRPPAEVTNCNCTLCRRVGGLWAYYPCAEVQVAGDPEHTDSYVQGDRTLRTVRCKTCGCVTHWEPLDRAQHPRMGVNMRMFEPGAAGDYRIKLLDGAESWEAFYWEDIARPAGRG